MSKTFIKRKSPNKEHLSYVEEDRLYELLGVSQSANEEQINRLIIPFLENGIPIVISKRAGEHLESIEKWPM